MFDSLEKSWKKELSEEFEKSYIESLSSFVKNQYKSKTIYPEEESIFSAFEECLFDKVKVVIIGQDPYHGVNQANGLCFSVSEGVKHPPSLVNIFKERKTDLGILYPKSGDLTAWSRQGVLLLNATLTVESHISGSHQNKGWETFTDAVIKLISEKKENVVFVLWGGYAQKKGKVIDSTKHQIIKSAHPSPLSVYRGFWDSKPFSKVNQYLKECGLPEVDWRNE